MSLLQIDALESQDIGFNREVSHLNWRYFKLEIIPLIENIFSLEGTIRAEISCLEKVWVYQKHTVLVSSGLLTKYSLFGRIKLASS